MKDVGSWLVPLIVHIIKSKGRESILRFKETEDDTPLHAAARLAVITGMFSNFKGFEIIN